MSIGVNQTDPQYLHSYDCLTLNDKVNVDISGKYNSSNIMNMDGNVNQSSTRAEDESWNLELTVLYDGLQCPPSSEFFKVPPCTGPYPNYNLTITTSDGKNISVTTDSNGKFKTLLEPGSYVITAASMKDTYFTVEANNIKRLNLLISGKGLE